MVDIVVIWWYFSPNPDEEFAATRSQTNLVFSPNSPTPFTRAILVRKKSAAGILTIMHINNH